MLNEAPPRSSKACPDAMWWNDLLEGCLSRKEETGLGTHLENCSECQQTLERLTGGDGSWFDIAHRLDHQSKPIALRRLMEKLKADTSLETVTHAEGPPADVDLSFLRPPIDPTHLGCLGRYQVLGVIGRGGMGVVLRAVDPGLGRVVAIKVLAPQWATSASARQRFKREARATAMVRHE